MAAINNKLSLLERMIRRWNLVEKVVTSASLGISDQLSMLPEIIGCDCVLLASSLRSKVGINGEYLSWEVRRAFPQNVIGFNSSNANGHIPQLDKLFSKVEELGKKAQESQINTNLDSQKEDNEFFFDWGCQNINSQKHFIEIQAFEQRQDKKENDFLLSEEETKPIEIVVNEEKMLITHVGVVLLGSINIGSLDFGESYLIFLDISKTNDLPSPNEWVSTVKEDCVPFFAYLGEVNANFNRLFSLNHLNPIERMGRIKEMTEIERDAYLRSASRLTNLLNEGLSPTIETLTQMNSYLVQLINQYQKNREIASSMGIVGQISEITINNLINNDHSNINNLGKKNLLTKSNSEIKRIEETLASLVHNSFPVLKDSSVDITDDMKTTKSDHINRQIEWTQIWWEIERLHHLAQHHDIDNFRDWSTELNFQLNIIKNKISVTPSKAWFHLGNGDDGLLVLSGPCLAGFLVSQVVCYFTDQFDPEKLKFSEKSDPRGIEVLTFIRKLIIIIRYALGCIHADENVLQAILWLLSEIGHKRFGVDRRLDFEKHLCLAAMEQPALYGLKAFYRDHLNHVIQVCLTGWLFILTEFSGEKKVGELIQVNDQKYEELMGEWFVASLLHDVGYVINIGTGWADLLKKFKDQKVFGVLSEQTYKMIEDWGEINTDWKGWEFQSSDNPGKDHGIVSALHVKSAIEEIFNPCENKYESALKAIAHHNHPNAKIKFSEEKLSVLLALCDELQEWDRPWLDIDKAALALSTFVTFNPGYNTRWHEPVNKVSTNIRLNFDKNKPTELHFSIIDSILDFSIDYSDAVHWNHSVFNTWLGRSRNLQRINLGDKTNCPLDFRFRMKNPVAPPRALFDRDPSEPELARLWRIVREQRIWSVHKWLEIASNGDPIPKIGCDGTKHGVMYELLEDGRFETVILDVRKLGEEVLITDDLKEFWDRLGKWRFAQDSTDDSLG